LKCTPFAIGEGSGFVCTRRPRRFFPAMDQALADAGYICQHKAKWCDCGVCAIWFKTPAGKWIPLEKIPDGRWEPHHANCKNVRAYRQANAQHRAHAAEGKPAPPAQGKLFGDL
jgi:hypothetical protein